MTRKKTVARRVRRQLGRCELACYDFARTLREALRGDGYAAERVWGHVLVDGNWRDQWGRGPVDWFDEHDDVDRRALPKNTIVRDAC